MSKITYTNKVDLYEDTSIADINKVKASDMNEIKTVVNNNDNNTTANTNAIGTLSELNTTNKSSIVEAMNELFTMGVDSYQLATNGYIRFVNGLQIAWAEKSFSFTMTSWGNIYYYDLSGMPDWVVPFTRVYQKHTTCDNKQFWFSNDDASITNPGNIRVLRATGGNHSIWVKTIAIGQWK